MNFNSSETHHVPICFKEFPLLYAIQRGNAVSTLDTLPSYHNLEEQS